MSVPRIVIVTLLICLLVLAGFAVATAQTEPPVRPGGAQQMEMVGLAENIVVSIKDHGDSQTVLVYKINSQGKATPTDKKKFYY